MRVLLATNMYPNEVNPAHGVFVKAQEDALREVGVDVDVFLIRGRGRAASYVDAIRALRRIVRTTRVDLVFAFYGLTGWVASMQPRPMVLSLAGDDLLGTPDGRGGLTLRSKVGILLSQWAALRAAAVCVQSEEMHSRLWLPKVRRLARVVPYGVDHRRFHPGDRPAARLKLGMKDDERVILFPNYAEHRKRYDLATAASEIVQRSIPGARLRVVAKVPHEEMPLYYQAADCLLLTSDWEGSPNVVKEALLSGLPVVSTDVGDVRKWLALSPESEVCDRTPDGIAQCLVRVLELRGRVNPAPFVRAFSSQAITRTMLGVFEEVLGRRDDLTQPPSAA